MEALPPSGGFLSAIRKSSQDLRISNGISITSENIQRLLFSPYFTTSFQRVSKNNGLTLPLKFSSYLDELNFLAVLSLLNFGSGFRVPLHAQTGRGAWDSIRALVFSMYITLPAEGDLLSAKGMRTITVAKIADLMHLNLYVERPHAHISGVTVGELGGPLHKLVQMIAAVLNETGEILDHSGYENLGSFVAESLQHAGKFRDISGEVEAILERLTRAFPAFRDMSNVHGQRWSLVPSVQQGDSLTPVLIAIYCFKKALFLIHVISIRFGSLSPQPFPIPNTNNIPIFSDNVLPSLLVHLGVIRLPSDSLLSNLFPDAGQEDALSKLLGPVPQTTEEAVHQVKTEPKEGPKVTPQQSYILRAAAIDACQLIVETAQSLDAATLDEKNLAWLSKLTLPDLDMWIWSAAKDRPDYRALVRFADQDTIYF